MYEVYAKLRDEKGVTNYEVAKTLHISQSTFSEWKSGRITPKLPKLKKLADYFGVSVTVFIE